MKYRLIYADPPWTYRDKAADGERGSAFKYQTMALPDICRLPVWDVADPDSCLLAMWWVSTQPLEALKVVDAWGFRLMTMKGFTWHKTNRKKGNSAIGMGHMTRGNSEDCLFAVRGRLPERKDASICQHITAPRMEHSAKPPVIRDLLVGLLGDIPRIELFARESADGWHTWGNECDNNIELFPGSAGRKQQSNRLSDVDPIPETANRIWPEEVHFLFDQVPAAGNLPDQLQNKIRSHINRMKLEGMPTEAIISQTVKLTAAMGATA